MRPAGHTCGPWCEVLDVPPPPRDLLRYAVGIALVGGVAILWNLPKWVLVVAAVAGVAVVVADWVRYARWVRRMQAAVRCWTDQNAPGDVAGGPHE